MRGASGQTVRQTRRKVDIYRERRGAASLCLTHRPTLTKQELYRSSYSIDDAFVAEVMDMLCKEEARDDKNGGESAAATATGVSQHHLTQPGVFPSIYRILGDSAASQ